MDSHCRYCGCLIQAQLPLPLRLVQATATPLLRSSLCVLLYFHVPQNQVVLLVVPLDVVLLALVLVVLLAYQERLSLLC